MRRFSIPTLALATALAVGGCAGGTVGYYDDPRYYDTGYYGGGYGPQLAYVSPGVQVVAGYDYPVFYSNNLYWRYHNNRWYRSPYWNRGWVYATPPRAIARIDRPYRYRNYRPSGYTVRRGSSYYRDTRPVQRPYYDGRRQYQPQRGYDGRRQYQQPQQRDDGRRQYQQPQQRDDGQRQYQQPQQRYDGRRQAPGRVESRSRQVSPGTQPRQVSPRIQPRQAVPRTQTPVRTSPRSRPR